MINKQDFLNAIEQNIEMVRGDLLSFDFQLVGLGASRPSFTFACCKEYEEEALFTATNGYGITLEAYDSLHDVATYSVAIAPNKTKNLDTGLYYYDLSFNLSGQIVTLMRGSLTLLHDVKRG